MLEQCCYIAGRCFRHKELLTGELVLWEPLHGHRAGRGRPCATFDVR